MQRPARLPPNSSTEHPFVYSLPPRISPNRKSMYPQYQTIFNVFKTMSHLRGTVMLKPKRNKPHMPTKAVDKNRITRLGTKCTWRVRICDFVSKRRAGAPSSIPGMSAHSRSPKQNQKHRITLSFYLLNSESTPKFTPDVSSLRTTATQNYSQVEYLLIHLPSTLRTSNMLLRLSSTIVRFEDHGNSWYIGKAIRIRRILGLRSEILMRKWYRLISKDWRLKRVIMRHIKWNTPPLRHHQRVGEGGVQGHDMVRPLAT